MEDPTTLDQMVYIRLGVSESEADRPFVRFVFMFLRYLEKNASGGKFSFFRWVLGTKNLLADTAELGFLRIGNTKGFFIPISYARAYAKALGLMLEHTPHSMEFEHVSLMRRLHHMLDAVANKEHAYKEYPQWAELPAENKKAPSRSDWLADKPTAPNIPAWRPLAHILRGRL